MGYVLAIIYYSGQVYYKQFPTVDECRGVLFQMLEDGRYKTVYRANCINLNIEDF